MLAVATDGLLLEGCAKIRQCRPRRLAPNLLHSPRIGTFMRTLHFRHPFRRNSCATNKRGVGVVLVHLALRTQDAGNCGTCHRAFAVPPAVEQSQGREPVRRRRVGGGSLEHRQLARASAAHTFVLGKEGVLHVLVERTG
jgi:hypothetical protein